MIARIFGCLLAVGCACNCVSVAQAPTPAPAGKPRFAIEYPAEKGFPPIYEPIPGYCSTQVCLSLKYGENLHRLANPDPAIRQPTVLELMVKVEGDEVSITPWVYYGAFDPKGTSRPIPSVEKQDSETLDTYSGRLNDSITLSALERVGLEPMTLEIVSAQLDSPYHPLMRSKAPSLDMEYAPEDRTSGTVTIHNRSSKAVAALQFGTTDVCDGGWTESTESGGQNETIAAGASYRTVVANNPCWEKVDGKMVEQLPTSMTLQAVVFADGSYEGDMHTSAEMAARQNGSVAQRQRILGLIAPILADTQSDDMVKAGLIHTAVQQLTVDPDAQMLVDFHTQFPSLSDSGYSDAKKGLSVGMKNEKERFDYDIEQFATGFGGSASQKSHPLTLERWLALSYVKTNTEIPAAPE